MEPKTMEIEEQEDPTKVFFVMTVAGPMRVSQLADVSYVLGHEYLFADFS